MKQIILAVLKEAANKPSEHVSREVVEKIATTQGFYGRFERAVDFSYEQVNDLLAQIEKKTTIRLYRILRVPPEKQINKKEIGQHCSRNNYRDDRFLYDIGILDYFMSRKAMVTILNELYEVTLEANKDDIDIEEYIRHSLLFPDEDEVTLKPQARPKIVSINRYKWDESDLEHPF